MARVVAFGVRPAGSVPVAIEKVNGAVPPETDIAGLLKATPTSPVFVVEQITDGAGTMVNGQVPGATTPFASVTLIVNVPAAVGVPAIAPVEVLSVRHAGIVPVATEKVKGAVPPVIDMAGLLNAAPTSPLFVVEHATEGGATMVNGQVPAATMPLASVTLIVKEPAAVGV